MANNQITRPFRNRLISDHVNESKVLSQSRYDLSRDEGRVLMMGIERSTRTDSANSTHDTNEYWFDVADYADVFGLSRDEALKDIKAALDRLYERSVFVKHDGGIEEKYRWIGSVLKNKAIGMYGFAFWPDILPFVNDLKEQIALPTSWLAGIKKGENNRLLKWIYEVLYEEQLYLTVEDMRYRLDLQNKGSYKIYNNFKRRILEPAVENINQITPLEVEYREVKKGRAIVGVQFTWKTVGIQSELFG